MADHRVPGDGSGGTAPGDPGQDDAGPEEETEEQTALIVRQSGQVPITTFVPQWIWVCGICGWLGTGWTNERQAEGEGADHVWDEHAIAVCFPDQFGGPHEWEHVQGSDSVDECQRCGWQIGK